MCACLLFFALYPINKHCFYYIKHMKRRKEIEESDMELKNTHCTLCTEGKVVGIKSKGLEFPTIITVEYNVGEKVFQIKEDLKLKNTTLKIGIIPIGQKKKPVLGYVRIGSIVTVAYNPGNPEDAYLPDNIRKINV